MRILFRRLAIVAVALVPAAVGTVATPAVGGADQCPDGRTWDPVTVMCDPPPPVPAWYQAAPAYAQSWAPPWAPPPPPTPDWAKQLDLKPVWDPKAEEWRFIYVR
jgi:hypothetical protein